MLYFRRYISNKFPLYVGSTNKRLPSYSSTKELREAEERALARGDRYMYGRWIDRYSDDERFVEESPHVMYNIEGEIPEEKMKGLIDFCTNARIEIKGDIV